MENKHTAGKWTVGTTESGPDNCKRAMVYAEFPYDMQETICVVSGLNGTEPGETAKVNAKLIAASPLLLEALKEALTIIDRMGEEYRTATNKHDSFTNGEFKRLDAAIKAATN